MLEQTIRSHFLRAWRSTVLILSLVAAGCASTAERSRAEGSGPNRLVRAELAQFDDDNAYRAIQRLRNTWLRARGGNRAPPALIVDGVPRIDGVQGLFSIRVQLIEEIQYLSGPDATTRYGTGYPGGVIIVTLRGD